MPAPYREGGKARTRHGIHQGIPVGTGKRLRVHIRDGCRLQPQPCRPAPAVQGVRRGRI